MCVINCLLIFLIFSFLAMPQGGELSSFKVPGVGNLLHSWKYKSRGYIYCRGGGGMATAGIEPCIRSM